MLEITPPRFAALVTIGANPGMSQSALGSVLGIARSGAMILTDWMEGRALDEDRKRAAVLSSKERAQLLRLLNRLAG